MDFRLHALFLMAVATFTLKTFLRMLFHTVMILGGNHRKCSNASYIYHLQGETKSFSRIIRNKTWLNFIIIMDIHGLKNYCYVPPYLNTNKPPKKHFMTLPYDCNKQDSLSDLKGDDLVNIAIYGAHFNSKTHLQMAQPQNFQELLKLPMVRDAASIQWNLYNKTTCLERPQNLVVALYRFHCIWKTHGQPGNYQSPSRTRQIWGIW